MPVLLVLLAFAGLCGAARCCVIVARALDGRTARDEAEECRGALAGRCVRGRVAP